MSANAPNLINPSLYSSILVNLTSSPTTAVAIVGGTLLTTYVIGSYVWGKFEDALDVEIYGTAEQKALKSLKAVYRAFVTKDAIDGKTPATWELDEKQRPKYYLSCSDLIRTLNASISTRDNCGFLHSYVIDYCTFAAGIVKARGDYCFWTWSNKGKPGDPSELFFAENIEWALHIMPAMGPNQQTLDAIDDRIKYLIRVKTDPNILIWKTGVNVPDANQLTAVNKLIKCLKSSKDYVARAVKQQVTRDKLADLKQNSQEILRALFHYLYRMRDEAVTFPLGLFEMFSQSAQLTATNNRLFERFFATHTGRMLKEALLICGPRPFGIESPNSLPLTIREGYLDNSGAEMAKINNMDIPAGVPPWLRSDSNTDETEYLVRLRKLLIQMVIFSRAQQLLVSAYEIAGHLGDAWILGTDAGKLAIKTITAIVADQRTELDSAFEELDVFSETRKDQYFDLHKVTGERTESKIWVDAKYFYDSYVSKADTMNERLVDLVAHVSNIPKDFEKEVSHKRAALILDVCEFIQIHRQDKIDEALELRKYIEIDIDKDHTSAYQARIRERNVDELKSAFEEQVSAAQYPLQNLMFNIKVDPVSSLLVMSNDQYHELIQALPDSAKLPEAVQWKLGDSYDAWIAGFAHRCSLHFEEYEKNARILNNRLANKTKIRTHTELDMFRETSNVVIANMRRALGTIKQVLERTKPAWRMGVHWIWGIIPIPYPKTIGWPFNDLANQFSLLLAGEIKNRRKILDFDLPGILQGIQPSPLEVPHQLQSERHENDIKLEEQGDRVKVVDVELFEISDDGDDFQPVPRSELAELRASLLGDIEVPFDPISTNVSQVKKVDEVRLGSPVDTSAGISVAVEVKEQETSVSQSQDIVRTSIQSGLAQSSIFEMHYRVLDEQEEEKTDSTGDEAEFNQGPLGLNGLAIDAERTGGFPPVHQQGAIAQEAPSLGGTQTVAAIANATSSITSVTQMLANEPRVDGSHAPHEKLIPPLLDTQKSILERDAKRLEMEAEIDRLSKANTLKREIFGAIVKSEKTGQSCLKILTQENLELLCEVRVTQSCQAALGALVQDNYSKSRIDYMNILLVVVSQEVEKIAKLEAISYYLAKYPSDSQPKELVLEIPAYRSLMSCGQEARSLGGTF